MVMYTTNIGVHPIVIKRTGRKGPYTDIRDVTQGWCNQFQGGKIGVRTTGGKIREKKGKKGWS